MKFSRLSAVIVLSTSLVACTLFPGARNVAVVGTVRDGSGDPVPGVRIYYVVLRYQPGMPATGEHGTVTTDLEGRYSVKIRKVYDAVSLSEIHLPVRCGGLRIDIPVVDFTSTNRLQRDFVCRKGANNSFKPKPLRGSA